MEIIKTESNPLHPGDKFITKKKHPCGGREWKVLRTGQDIKLKCLSCGKTVMLTLDAANKARLKPKTKKHIHEPKAARAGVINAETLLEQNETKEKE